MDPEFREVLHDLLSKYVEERDRQLFLEIWPDGGTAEDETAMEADTEKDAPGVAKK
jgi:hypothetical protein